MITSAQEVDATEGIECCLRITVSIAQGITADNAGTVYIAIPVNISIVIRTMLLF